MIFQVRDQAHLIILLIFLFSIGCVEADLVPWCRWTILSPAFVENRASGMFIFLYQPFSFFRRRP